MAVWLMSEIAQGDFGDSKRRMRSEEISRESMEPVQFHFLPKRSQKEQLGGTNAMTQQVRAPAFKRDL